MRTKRQREDGGGALVEFVVLMLIFVPLILLPMYFQDALRYRLDVQEAVYSTTWDFAYANYQDNSVDTIAGGIESANQNIFGNLWSGNDFSKSDPAGPWADFSWNQQLACSNDEDFGTDVYPSLANDFHGLYTNGGLVTCRGSISVANHYIPQFFLQESDPGGMAQQDLFAPGTGQIDYPRYQLGLLVDPWCIHRYDDNGQDGQDVTEDGKGNELFFERVEYVWKEGAAASTHSIFESKWLAFLRKLTEEIASPAILGGFLDNPTKLKITSLHPLKKGNDLDEVGLGGLTTFFVSPYEDGQDDKFKETYENRGEYYLGCTEFEDNCGD